MGQIFSDESTCTRFSIMAVHTEIGGPNAIINFQAIWRWDSTIFIVLFVLTCKMNHLIVFHTPFKVCLQHIYHQPTDQHRLHTQATNLYSIQFQFLLFLAELTKFSLRAGNTSSALCRIIVGIFVASDFKPSFSYIMASWLFKKLVLRTSHIYFHSFMYLPTS